MIADHKDPVLEEVIRREAKAKKTAPANATPLDNATPTYHNAEGILVVRVIVRELCFRDGHRIKPGEVIELPVSELKEWDPTDNSEYNFVRHGGKCFLLPHWSEPDDEFGRRLVAHERQAAERKFAAGVLASSGGGGRRLSFKQALAGGAPLPRAAQAALAAATPNTVSAAKKAEIESHQVADLQEGYSAPAKQKRGGKR